MSARTLVNSDQPQARTINELLLDARSNSVVRSRLGLYQQRGGGGVFFRRPSGLQPAPRRIARASWCPFDITVEGGVATFVPGTINNLLPSNYVEGVAVGMTGTYYLVLSCSASSGAITNAQFAADMGSPPAFTPTAGTPPSSFKILVGVVVDGVPFKILGCGNIQMMIVEAFRIQKAVPVAGQVPYDIYYTWLMLGQGAGVTVTQLPP